MCTMHVAALLCMLLTCTKKGGSYLHCMHVCKPNHSSYTYSTWLRRNESVFVSNLNDALTSLSWSHMESRRTEWFRSCWTTRRLPICSSCVHTRYHFWATLVHYSTATASDRAFITWLIFKFFVCFTRKLFLALYNGMSLRLAQKPCERWRFLFFRPAWYIKCM